MASVQLMNNSNDIKKDNVHTISINSNNDSFGLNIDGLLQNGISIAYKPEYTNLSELVPFGGTIKDIANELGKKTGSLVLDGIAEQQYYTGAKPITINAIIKVIDYDGTGKPLDVASKIASFCQPTASLDKMSAAIVNLDLKNGLDAVKETLAGTGVTSLLSKNIVEASKDLGRTVNVRISDFLYFPQMIIDSASQEFSYEQGISGPVSATFTITMTTFRTPDSADVLDFYKKPGEQQSRIKYVGGN